MYIVLYSLYSKNITNQKNLNFDIINNKIFLKGD